MKKKTLLATSALAALALTIPALCVKPTEAFAEGEETSQAPVVSESGDSQQASAEPAPAFPYLIKDAKIGYREGDKDPYVEGDSKIGSYFLSADGWNVEDAADVVMTVKGAVTSKLDGKIVYIYEYKPTLVKWAGAEVKPQEDGTYRLAKPAEPGSYDLELYFTDYLVTNPVDLTRLDWASFLTVQNLMTIGSWVAIVAFGIVFFFLNQRNKNKGQTDLQGVQRTLTSAIENKFGKEMADQMDKLFTQVISKTFDEINSKLSKVDGNSAIMLRCLLLMQENTPEARLAITELLTKLQTEEDGKAAEVKALINAEMEKYKADKDELQKALDEAKAINAEWSEQKEEEPKPGDDYGTL